MTAIPKQDPSNPAVGRTIDRLRAQLPPAAFIGGAVAENHDLQAALSAKAPLVIAVVVVRPRKVVEERAGPVRSVGLALAELETALRPVFHQPAIVHGDRV